MSYIELYDAVSKGILRYENNDDTNDNNSIGIGRYFVTNFCPNYLSALESLNTTTGTSNAVDDNHDRLVKIGRNIFATMSGELFSKEQKAASLQLLLDECIQMAILLSPSSLSSSGPDNNNNNQHIQKIPTVRFGKTELEMPIITLGSMRFQQSWNRGGDGDGVVVSTMEDVQQECQDNLIRILKHAIRLGITHIETAKGYGCSELQLGNALLHLFNDKTLAIQRSDLIIQTKGGVIIGGTKEEYKTTIREQLKRLQLDYVDLFSVHGINRDVQLETLFGDASNQFAALEELRAEGCIRHIGFSSHGSVEVIRRTIETNQFDYCNLHYHFLGSYTASGDTHEGNRDNLHRANARDMGVFIISPYDKGGRLYAPSTLLRSLTLPDLEPMAYGSLWLWSQQQQQQQHQENDTDTDSNVPMIHTIVCGAARPSDLDQPVVAALAWAAAGHKGNIVKDKVCSVSKRLHTAMVQAMGGNEQYRNTWTCGLPNSTDSNYGTQLGNIVWLSHLIQAYGVLEYAKERYQPMQANRKKWDISQSKEDNMTHNISPGWGWMPGTSVDPNLDYSEDLSDTLKHHDCQQTLLTAIQFVHEWCNEEEDDDNNDGDDNDNDNTVKKKKKEIPLGWQTSYDMRPWTAFPERP